MKIKDKEAYDRMKSENKNGYGAVIIRYAEKWAKLMEEKMAQGKTIKDIAKDTSLEANTEDITCPMYVAAVSVLSVHWEFGEELRRWHNLDVQIGDEGEKANENGTVLRPDLFIFGDEKKE